MVHVFVADITTLEGVVRTAVVEHHAHGVARLVVDDVALGIASDRSGILHGETRVVTAVERSLCSVLRTISGEILVLVIVREVTVVVVVVSIDTLEAETVDGTEAVAHFDAAHHAFVLIVEVGVHGLEDVLIHLGQRVDVLGDVGTEDYAELAILEDRLGADVEFPTFVLHLTDVAVAERREAGAGGDAYTAHEEVAGVLVVNVEVELNEVVEEVQVSTDVPRARLFPLNLGEAEVFRSDTCYTVVVTVAAIFIIDESFAEPSVTIDTPTRTNGEHADNGAERLEELFVGDIPTTGDTGEYTPLATGTELRHTVGTNGEIDAVLRAEAVVESSECAGRVSLPGAGGGTVEITGHGGVSDTAVDT